VRAELDGLTLQERDPVTGEQRNRVVVEVSPDGAEQLYAFVVQMAEQAAYLTKKALLLREGVTPALVLHAAAEQLEDTMIRSGTPSGSSSGSPAPTATSSGRGCSARSTPRTRASPRWPGHVTRWSTP
jgi:hypothetical protein